MILTVLTGLATAVDLRRLLEQGVITNRAMLAMASESGDFGMGNEKHYGDYESIDCGEWTARV